MSECVYKVIHYSLDGSDLLDLFKDEPCLFFLDSSLQDERRGRFSFIGFDPFDVFRCRSKDFINQLKIKTIPFRKDKTDGFLPFESGIVGCLAYDFGLYDDHLRRFPKAEHDLPDGHFGLYDCIITVDHYTHKLYISSTGMPEKNIRLRQIRATARLDYILKKMEKLPIVSNPPILESVIEEPLGLKSNFTRTQYVEAVYKALEYIRKGDIYQVNLSQLFKLDHGGDFDGIETYRILRQLSPSFCGGFIDAGDFQILSSSPEQFLSLKGNLVQTRPMKGTRRRGFNECEDRQLKEELKISAKDKAELLMITDLLRNDLGRVCQYGSISVETMRLIEEYNTVFQATSTIKGVLEKNKDGFDLIEAAFPGGSITGCPKLRAMEVIEELEPSRRSFYTGTMGYMDFGGNMEFNILIRTLINCRNKISFQVGAGIVADSNPEKEYEETLIKANAMCQCLQKMQKVSL